MYRKNSLRLPAHTDPCVTKRRRMCWNRKCVLEWSRKSKRRETLVVYCQDVPAHHSLPWISFFAKKNSYKNKTKKDKNQTRGDDKREIYGHLLPYILPFASAGNDSACHLQDHFRPCQTLSGCVLLRPTSSKEAIFVVVPELHSYSLPEVK